MAKVLLINPSYQGSYGGSKASIVNPIFPTLGLATIAAVARQSGHQIKMLDLSWRQYHFEEIRRTIIDFKVDIVGITATTPLMNQLRDITVLVKDISKNILTVAGGAHPSAMPVETMQEAMLDVVFVSEADYSVSFRQTRVTYSDRKFYTLYSSGRRKAGSQHDSSYGVL